ncbi:hypothetical protein E2C01_045926 [Portunus trituberculatus]|uniref:Uncharacterized protein n=1 Tax=Portunus trituberculatus TaxID=210409 RepID=A0A5B7G2P3_PORTR|nr:hypothetical protein [Portunus trituberculatus]
MFFLQYGDRTLHEYTALLPYYTFLGNCGGERLDPQDDLVNILHQMPLCPINRHLRLSMSYYSMSSETGEQGKGRYLRKMLTT